MKNTLTTVSFVLALTWLFSAKVTADETKLPALNALPEQSAISGLSSGGFMAAQFHVAYSNDLIGAGIIAGGPWNCAGSHPEVPPAINAVSACMDPCKKSQTECSETLFPDAGYLAELAKLKAQSGEIDPVENLKSDRLYIFSGENDKIVLTGVTDKTVEFYHQLGVSDDHILYEHNVNAGHAFITTDPTDSQCSDTAPPYINYCKGFPLAQRIFQQIYGKVQPATSQPAGELLEFNQAAFFSDPLTSMDKHGYVYIPKGCRSHPCRVHIALHGCTQGISEIGTTYIRETGYLEIAETNETIVLFPQIRASKTNPVNPKGCWDFWGYSTNFLPPLNYYLKSAPQMVAIKKMLDRLISAPAGQAKKI
ncbi:hypothetical protein VA7868_03189 [Vibrio aerogenes CECT 7868]|uniref:Esterase PHB depolymerase n=1 Tax=Vibrio aerogenes CECT 7868 TaxID=1216006 RepID=A0A1M5ZTB0_9VIBR|nr:poly(3-hydroxybutyrate) depolymerase [Vibrio aerogenes]SHI27418.1 hypothetical protein VA7868_03189 [Vibrio aerogenes CECT 7868]